MKRRRFYHTALGISSDMLFSYLLLLHTLREVFRWADRRPKPQFRSRCRKGVLDKGDLQCLLSTKLEAICGEPFDEQSPATKKALRTVVQKYNLRPKTTNPLSLDARCSSHVFLRDVGALPNIVDAPLVEARRRRNQGELRYTREIRRIRNDCQRRLFELWKTNFPQQTEGRRIDFATGRMEKMVEEDYGYTRLHTAEFCDFLDKMTISLKGRYENGGDMDYVRRLSAPLKKILAFRIVEDSLVQNDILDEKDYVIWKEHVWVVSSYATMLIILEAIAITNGQTIFP